MGSSDDKRIEDILKHLDGEIERGAVRMSVIMDENSDEEKSVSHICCNSYGKHSNETVGLLDMYTDMNAGEPDNYRSNKN